MDSRHLSINHSHPAPVSSAKKTFFFGFAVSADVIGDRST